MKVFAVFSFLSVLLAVSVVAQNSDFPQDTARIDLNRVIPEQDQERTGITKLTPEERILLQDWLVNWDVTQLSFEELLSTVQEGSLIRDKLTRQERGALDQMIRQWKLTSAYRTPSTVKPYGTFRNYRYPDESRTIREPLTGNNSIVLNDGAQFEIDALDRRTATIWSRQANIVILETDNPIYPYQLWNTDRNERINVRYVGQE